MSKGIFQSKTFWINAITTAIALGTTFAGQDYVANNPSYTTGIFAGIGVLNIALRVITNQPIKGM